jgi:hypothetical protein
MPMHECLPAEKGKYAVVLPREVSMRSIQKKGCNNILSYREIAPLTVREPSLRDEAQCIWPVIFITMKISI